MNIWDVSVQLVRRKGKGFKNTRLPNEPHFLLNVATCNPQCWFILRGHCFCRTMGLRQASLWCYGSPRRVKRAIPSRWTQS